jgi:hypothetical protein
MFGNVRGDYIQRIMDLDPSKRKTPGTNPLGLMYSRTDPSTRLELPGFAGKLQGDLTFDNFMSGLNRMSHMKDVLGQDQVSQKDIDNYLSLTMGKGGVDYLDKDNTINPLFSPTGGEGGPQPGFSTQPVPPVLPPGTTPPDDSWDSSLFKRQTAQAPEIVKHDFSGIYADGGRAGYAGGGIADLRQGYFLGKIVKSITKPFKKATRAVKKIAKSPLGKAALMYAMSAGLGNIMTPAAQRSPWLSGKWLNPSRFLSTGHKWGKPYKDASGILTRESIGKHPGYLSNIFQRQAPTASWLKEAGMEAGKEATDKYLAQDWWKKLNPWTTIGIPAILGLTAMGDDDEDELYKKWLAEKKATDEYWIPRFDESNFQRQRLYSADGGRIRYDNGGYLYDDDDDEEDTDYVRAIRALSYRPRAQEGGLMDMGGMEKDYRNDGGFVPIGGQERADDVPARLSKNEFVFTADAVRAAGGGDIDAGAEIMENVMENLEQGGEISQQSQGLEGARNMFATSQRLEGVL